LICFPAASKDLIAQQVADADALAENTHWDNICPVFQQPDDMWPEAELKPVWFELQ